MESKVYCKNCKYYHHYYSLHKPFGGWCSAEPIYKDRYDEKVRVYLIPLEKQNKDNNCSLYKRKWYKFWI